MTPEALVDYLTERLGDRVLEGRVVYGQPYITVTPESWVDAVRLCKEDDALGCGYWECLDAVDRQEDGFEVVTNVYSIEHRHRVILKALVPGGRERPVMPSLAGVYRGANWSERETYDMFGIDFEGHPRLLPRILTVENFEGWPLRKDFLLSSREAKPWPGSKEPEERKSDDQASSPTAGEAPVSAEEKAAAAKAKAERAKKKAAAMRAKKAEERAADQVAQAEEAADAPPPASEALGPSPAPQPGEVPKESDETGGPSAGHTTLEEDTGGPRPEATPAEGGRLREPGGAGPGDATDGGSDAADDGSSPTDEEPSP